MDAIVLHAGLAQHNGDWNWQNVRSPFARIYYVTEGSAEIVFHKRTCSLSPGKLYLVPPFVTHSNRCQGEFAHYYIHIYEPVDAVSGIFEDYSLPCEVQAEEHDKWLFERICLINSGKMLQQADPRVYDNPASLMQSVTESRTNNLSVQMESSGIVNQLLARFVANAVRTHHPNDTRIRQMRKFIRQNLHKNIPIDTLAEMTCLSKDHFIRLFKAECGESPLLYINHRKIELAETKLITTDLNIKEIAQMLGFTDYSYFIRLFRQTTGTTPAAYRKSAVKAK